MSTGSPAGTPTGGASRRQSNRRSSVNAAARAASANERARLQASLDQLHQDNEALQSEVDQLRQRTQPAQAPVLDDGVFAQEMIDKLLSKLDDNALTSLLSHNDTQMLAQLFGSDVPKDTTGISPLASTTEKAFAAIPAPAISAGIEGVGSGLEIDFRLATGQADSNGRVTKRRKLDIDKPMDEQWMEDWLGARRKRGESLLSTLQAFTGLGIEQVEQPGEGHSATGSSHVDVRGTMDQIGAVHVTFDVLRYGVDVPPRLERVQVDLPRSVRAAMEQDGHLDRLLALSSLPAIFMTINSLTHGAVARRKVFSAIASRVQTITSSDTQVSNADELNLESKSIDVRDDQDLRRWYQPGTADTLVLCNTRGAELRFHYRLTFDPFGRGLRTVTLEPWLPPSMRTTQAEEILAPMPAAFAKLAKEKPGIEGVPDTTVLADIVLNFATHFFGAT